MRTRRARARWGAVTALLASVLSVGGVLRADRQASAAEPAGDYWQASPACPRDASAPRDYAHCLYDTIRTSEQALEAEIANAMLVIDARADLAPAQRARWKSFLDEAQSRFLLYRNFDCQSVAPFEGPRGIGNFEQRALCLIGANTRRADDLRARYGRPTTALAATASADTPPEGPQTRRSVWVYAIPPTVD